jgi:hypothetical protein
MEIKGYIKSITHVNDLASYSRKVKVITWYKFGPNICGEPYR